MIVETQDKYPLETGGVLAGYRSENDCDIIITQVLGPGSRAFHGRFSYIPDYESDEERIGEVFDQSDGSSTYLGDWHSHPDNVAYLSWRDRWALRNISRYRENYIETPVMLILGGATDSFALGGWRVFGERSGFMGTRWDYVSQEIVFC